MDDISDSSIKRNFYQLMLQKYLFILINLTLGSVLLFTYYRGVTNNTDISSKLWGNVPQYLTPYIVSSMFIAAIGYFIFTYFILCKIDYNSVKIFNRFSFSFFIIIYLLILIPSCFWIDLSIQYIITGNLLLWKLIVLILYTVGISSIILLLSLISINPNNGSILYKLSIFGCSCFVFHTMCLDGLLWTLLFHK